MTPTSKKMLAWQRLARRIGMPRPLVCEYTPSGLAKVAASFEDVALFGQATMPDIGPDDFTIKPRIGFREWSQRMRETYGC